MEGRFSPVAGVAAFPAGRPVRERDFSTGPEAGAGEPEIASRPEPASASRRLESPARAEGAAPSPEAASPAWRKALAAARAAPLLWTYAELGQDLLGGGNRERSEGLREIIGKLRLAKGSSVFLPLTFEDDWPGLLLRASAPPDAVFFRQGLAQVNPKAVIFFGEHSLRLCDLPLGLRQPFTQQVREGRIFLLLPSWEKLLEGASAREQTADYVRLALSSLLRQRPTR
ncbi:MAG: hypothetical protein LBO77_04185 [Desulfovibrio sp.]|nr:hypothetical protein [Desulfovibrio sp.]